MVSDGTRIIIPNPSVSIHMPNSLIETDRLGGEITKVAIVADTAGPMNPPNRQNRLRSDSEWRSGSASRRRIMPQ